MLNMFVVNTYAPVSFNMMDDHPEVRPLRTRFSETQEAFLRVNDYIFNFSTYWCVKTTVCLLSGCLTDNVQPM